MLHLLLDVVSRRLAKTTYSFMTLPTASRTSAKR